MPRESNVEQLPDGSEKANLPEAVQAARKPRSVGSWLYPWFVVGSFLMGLLISYMFWGRAAGGGAEDAKALIIPTAAQAAETGGTDLVALAKQVNPPAGYELPVSYGELGPRLLEGGAIDLDAFAAVYQQAGEPLSAAQVDVLKRGADQPIIITAENAHFLLNFFWAVGLVNKNTILTEGPMVQNSGGQIDQFASTGGWTLGAKPVKELYASMDLIPLTDEQQKRVEQVASLVYRPCCGNATLFPDCNHGMAMLGLLELMASQGASVDELFTAAKYVSAYWFPQQMLETAIYLKASQGLDFIRADPRMVTGADYFSSAGSRQVHAALEARGLLPRAPNGGGSCGS